MRAIFTVSCAIGFAMIAATFMLDARAASLTPARAAERYALVLARMVDAAEAVHDSASARGAMRVLAEGTRERLAQDDAIEAMPAAAQVEYERLVAARQSDIDAKLARLDAAMARMMATPAYVLALAGAVRGG